MDKQTYLKRFSRAARWRLGHREAAEVVADYTELLEQRPPEQDNTLVEDLGKPPGGSPAADGGKIVSPLALELLGHDRLPAAAGTDSYRSVS